MAKQRQQQQIQKLPLFTLVEEATNLIRRTPLSAWLGYFIGTGPFIVYLFYFWSDMSRSASASARLLESSLLLSLLYGWMKVWHAIFSANLMRILKGQDIASKMPIRGWLRLVSSQVLVHSTMPWVLMLASVAMFPMAWAYSFYHNVSILALDHFQSGGRTKGLIGEALRQTHFLPKQNHLLILLISCVGFLVYLNFFLGSVFALTISKSITGTENAFTTNNSLFYSSSFQALLMFLSYLVMNPLIKSFYALRCFYGVSRRTGADIEASLRMLPPIVNKGLVAILLLCVASTSSMAQDPEVVATPMGAEQAADLDQSIKDVLQGSEFQWRMPRDAVKDMEAEESWLGTQIRSYVDWLQGLRDSFEQFLEDFFDWMFKRKSNIPNPPSNRDGNAAWLSALPNLVIYLAIGLFLLLVWMIIRHWYRSKKDEPVEVLEAPPEINLEAETVLASQMPENEWLKLAREKAEAGDLRLALRALFLATLSHLGEKRLLIIARSKSNGDYVRELGFRARSREGLYDGFKEQVRVFDQVWYGWHDVSHELMAKFEEQHERITSHAT